MSLNYTEPHVPTSLSHGKVNLILSSTLFGHKIILYKYRYIYLHDMYIYLHDISILFQNKLNRIRSNMCQRACLKEIQLDFVKHFIWTLNQFK